MRFHAVMLGNDAARYVLEGISNSSIPNWRRDLGCACDQVTREIVPHRRHSPQPWD